MGGLPLRESTRLTPEQELAVGQSGRDTGCLISPEQPSASGPPFPLQSSRASDLGLPASCFTETPHFGCLVTSKNAGVLRNGGWVSWGTWVGRRDAMGRSLGSSAGLGAKSLCSLSWDRLVSLRVWCEKNGCVKKKQHMNEWRSWIKPDWTSFRRYRINYPTMFTCSAFQMPSAVLS